VEIADVIIKNRSNEIRVKPGYDGVYGEPILSGGKDEKIIRKQKNLLDFS